MRKDGSIAEQMTVKEDKIFINVYYRAMSRVSKNDKGMLSSNWTAQYSVRQKTVFFLILPHFQPNCSVSPDCFSEASS